MSKPGVSQKLKPAVEKKPEQSTDKKPERILDEKSKTTDEKEENEEETIEEEKEEEILTENKNKKYSVDLSSLPNLLQNKFDKYGTSDSIRPGIVRAGEIWKRQRQENFFSSLKESNLVSNNLKTEKQRAFDLLDALTRSGGLSVDHSSIHVFIATAHCFEENLLSTVIERNINPIVELEKSTLLMASVIHEKEIKELISK